MGYAGAVGAPHDFDAGLHQPVHEFLIKSLELFYLLGVEILEEMRYLHSVNQEANAPSQSEKSLRL